MDGHSGPIHPPLTLPYSIQVPGDDTLFRVKYFLVTGQSCWLDQACGDRDAQGQAMPAQSPNHRFPGVVTGPGGLAEVSASG